MASAAQVLANRLNAQKSTGPHTAEGKAAVAQNAVKHGLLAREVVIKGEDPGEFEFYRDQMLGGNRAKQTQFPLASVKVKSLVAQGL